MARLFDDGSNQYLVNTNAVVSSAPMTMHAWCKSDDDTILGRLIGINPENDNDYIAINLDGASASDPVAAEYVHDASQVISKYLGFTANTWHAVTGVYTSSSVIDIYLDNNTGTQSGAPSASPVGMTRTLIGGGWYNGALVIPFSGSIAECAIWDVALFIAEIAILSKGYSPLFVRPQSLVAYWPLIGRTSPEIDIVGGYHMSLVNGPTAAAHPPVIYPATNPILTPLSAKVYVPRPGALSVSSLGNITV